MSFWLPFFFEPSIALSIAVFFVAVGISLPSSRLLCQFSSYRICLMPFQISIYMYKSENGEELNAIKIIDGCSVYTVCLFKVSFDTICARTTNICLHLIFFLYTHQILLLSFTSSQSRKWEKNRFFLLFAVYTLHIMLQLNVGVSNVLNYSRRNNFPAARLPA